MNYKMFFSCFLLLACLSMVSAAQGCTITVNAKTTTEFIKEIPSINTQIQACNPDLPVQVTKLIKDGTILIDITDDTDIVITAQNGAVTSITTGTPTSFSYKIEITPCQLTRILSSNNQLGAFLSFYLSGDARLRGGTVWNKVKLFFGKLFGKSKLQNAAIPVDACVKGSSNKPENCYETYMQGHEQYQYAKEEWDRRLKETGNICQTQTSEMPKGGECIYLFEQIKNNDKKWLCWYK